MSITTENIWQRLQASLAAWIGGILVVGFARWRLLGSLPETNVSAVSLLEAVWQDGVVLSIALLAIIILGRRLGVVLHSIVVALCLIAIAFHGKTQQPLSLALLDQVGGLLVLQPSLNALAPINLLIKLAGLYGVYWLTYLSLGRLQRRFANANLIVNIGVSLLIVAQWLGAIWINTNQIYAYNFLFGHWADAQQHAIAQAPAFTGLRPQPPEMINIAPHSHQRANVIVVVLETFGTRLVTSEATFELAMPKLAARRPSLSWYQRHYTPWPFSSKAIYSIICGQDPYPGAAVETRLAPDQTCASWSSSLRRADYELLALHSGEFAYDRYGEFLQTQGFQTLLERADLDTYGQYRHMDWFVEDRAMVDAMRTWWRDRKPQHFAAFLLATNSHHPFHVPDEKFNVSSDPYINTFRYQDDVIEDLFVWLESEALLDNTLVVLTGDHGPRGSPKPAPGTLPQSAFHVPTFVHWPKFMHNTTNAGETVTHPTGHANLAAWILRGSGVGGQVEQWAHPINTHSAYVFSELGLSRYGLVTETSSVLLDPESNQLFMGDRWVTSTKTACKGENCRAWRQALLNRIHHAWLRFPQFHR